MKSICIIPARGGSKRIPRKNIKEFMGKPIISYSIENAIKSELFDEIMVSTDDTEIAATAKDFGAEVPFIRSAKNANDVATTVDVIQEVIAQYADNYMHFDTVCCLYPCAPLIGSELLSTAFSRLQNSDFHSIIPIIKNLAPIQRCIVARDDKIEFLFPEYKNSRSQDLEATYRDAGQFYFFRPAPVLKYGKIMTNHTGYIILNENESQDIDNEEDWQLAEMKFKLKNC